MKRFLLVTLIALCFVLNGHSQLSQTITSANGPFLLKQVKLPEQSSNFLQTPIANIVIHPKQVFQEIEGFGYTLTGGSAALLHQLPKANRTALLNELFGQGPGQLNINYLRVSMGASDLDSAVFSYDDLPAGMEDPSLEKMSLNVDQIHLIPILQEIKLIQPGLKVIASPWSPPVWMKDNGQTKGGHLMPKHYATYAAYFVKYIQLMRQVGIQINAVTIQNEPEHGGNNPSMLMSASEQTLFIKNHLGPAFKNNRLNTEIVIWDHNADHPNYPIEVLNDSIAKSYIAASAFHLYLGEEAALSKVHDAHPDKKIYFTEQWTGSNGNFAGDFMWHMEHIVLGTLGNWSSMVLEWNLANDPKFGPHTPGGCTACLGALTIDGSSIQRNVSYYILAQVAPYIVPGSIRIGTQSTDASIQTIAFKRPDGKMVLVALNKEKESIIAVANGAKKYNFTLPEKSVSTIVW
jgi:glucosylceramidase